MKFDIKAGDTVAWMSYSGKKLTGKVVHANYGTFVIERNGSLITRTRDELI